MTDIPGRGWASWELSAVYQCCGTGSGTSHLEMSYTLKIFGEVDVTESL